MVELAKDGEEALEKLTKYQSEIVAMLLDLQMPKKDDIFHRDRHTLSHQLLIYTLRGF